MATRNAGDGSTGAMPEEFRLDDWHVRPLLHELEGTAGPVRVQPRSMEVLVHLARRAGKVVTREELLDCVWGRSFVTEEVLTQAIYDLRRAFGDDARDPRVIETLPRRGYRLLASVSWLESGVGESARYRLLEELGRGAIGVVYRAEDTRLHRTLALKFLHSRWSRDEVARMRFLREARLASALDHPNVATVYDVDETTDGRIFIAMALYEGETLKARLERGTLQVAQAVDLILQVADGLAAAHEQGVLHRDIKPANVVVTAEGVAKIVDFGLARLQSEADTSDPRGESASAEPLTEPGAAVGTKAYASPEQAQGRELDQRTDLFSLGVVLYEALTGTLPFGPRGAGAIVDGIGSGRPLEKPLLDPALPDGLARVVHTCLEADRERRYQSVRELTTELEQLGLGSGARRPAGREAARARRTWHSMVPWLVAGLGAVLGITALSLLSSRGPPEPPAEPIRFARFTADGGWKDYPRLSPDGERVAYSWLRPQRDSLAPADIYVKGLGVGAAPLRLTDHPGPDLFPVWSPDGREIAFTRIHDGLASIVLVPSSGGQERKLVDLVGPSRASGYPLLVLSWSADGKWLAFSEKSLDDEPARIVRLSLDSLRKEPLTRPPAQSLGDIYPVFSPDGEHLAFVRSGSYSWGDLDLWVKPLAGGEARRLTYGEYGFLEGPAWTPGSDELLYSAGIPLPEMAVRIGLEGGEPRPMPGVGANTAYLDVKDRRIVFQQRSKLEAHLWRMPGLAAEPEERVPQRLMLESGGFDGVPRYSPDGRRIAFVSARDRVGPGLWICEADGSEPTQLTWLEGNAGWPNWSPDGRWIVFDSLESGNYDLWVIDSEGGAPRQLTNHPAEDGRASWSRDGRWIYFGSSRSGDSQLWKIPAEGGEPVQVTRDGGFYAKESWDGRSLYYVRSGASGIFELPLTESGPSREVVSETVGWGQWHPARSGLYFLIHEEEPGFELGLPIGAQAYALRRTALRHLDPSTGKVVTIFRRPGIASFDVSPDEHWILLAFGPPLTSELVLGEGFQ